MAFDFKKEYKDLYQPKGKPALVEVPPMRYLAVRGEGNPNEENGAYQNAIEILYTLAYTLKMSYKGDHQIEGFFQYVVPPLEGFWWNTEGEKRDYCWISVIRVPDFIRREDFEWAVAEAARKKKVDCSSAELLEVEEGMCVQIMHLGPFDDEETSVAHMNAWMEKHGYQPDFSDTRLHHEIYLSDARRVPPEKWKTVIRHPVKKK